MDAPEYLRKKFNKRVYNNISSDYFTSQYSGYDTCKLMESYHQHKLSEITEDKIREAWYFFSNVTTEGELMTEQNFKKAISNLLKGER